MSDENNIQCPYCDIMFYCKWYILQNDNINPSINATGIEVYVLIRGCTCPSCKNLILQYGTIDGNYYEHIKNQMPLVRVIDDWTLLYPAVRYASISEYVPAHLAQDYKESVAILDISPKASAVLSRRCFQIILEEAGYKHRILSEQVELAQKDKTLPLSIRKHMDAVRNVGNNAAHAQRDIESDIIVDVTHEEAEFILQIIHRMFEHFYITPANDQELTNLIDEKLSEVGKPPIMKPNEPQA